MSITAKYLAVTAGGGILTALAGVFFTACVGDDPGSTAEPDAAAADSSPATDASSGVDATTGDAEVDAAPPPCNLAAPFGAPTPFDPVNTNEDEGDLRFSADGSLAYFTRGAFVTGNVTDVFVATKAGGFKDGTPVAGVNAPSTCCADAFPSITPDGLELVFYSNDGSDPLSGGPRVWNATRTSKNLAFSGRAPIAALAGISGHAPVLTHDGSAIYFSDLGSKEIKRSARIDGVQYAAPTVVMPNASSAAVTGDELTLYFARTGTTMVAKRSKITDSWNDGTAVPELASMVPSWVSPDGCTITLSSVKTDPKGNGGANVWTAAKPK